MFAWFDHSPGLRSNQANIFAHMGHICKLLPKDKPSEPDCLSELATRRGQCDTRHLRGLYCCSIRTWVTPIQGPKMLVRHSSGARRMSNFDSVFETPSIQQLRTDTRCVRLEPILRVLHRTGIARTNFAFKRTGTFSKRVTSVSYGVI